MGVEPARAAAFSPGHVTGLFEIHDEAQDLERRGSRGAGFSLSRGAVSLVEVAPAEQMEIAIRIDGAEPDAPITREAVTALLKQAVRDGRLPLNKDAPQGRRARIRVQVDTTLQLPVSQGFGMSAAGALSASLALAKCLRLGRSEALRAAHGADVLLRGGLGDVIGASVGGFEIRTAPGLPPYGATTRFVGHGDCVLCVVGGALETRSVLSDPAKRAAVNAAGREALAALLKAPTMDAFLEQSRAFARASGLLTPALQRAIDAASPHGRASMSMLGNSVFAFGNVRALEKALAPHGETLVVPIDEAGARIVQLG
ncbi:MAG: pantoate kinase [Thermoplasmata archaeon]|nr:pantoate kinase [Thermoplasmata archaeon]